MNRYARGYGQVANYRREQSDIYQALYNAAGNYYIQFVTQENIRQVAQLVREHGPGALNQAARTVAKGIKRAFKSGHTRSRFEANLGPEPQTQERPIRQRLFGPTAADVEMTDNNSGQFKGHKASYYVKKGGRILSRKKKLMATLQAHVQPIIERWGNSNAYAPANTPVTKTGIFNLTAGGLGAAGYVWPVFLFDLTGCKNVNSFGGDPLKNLPNVCWRLQSDATGGTINNFSYLIQGGKNSTDSDNSYSWFPEKLFRETGGLIPNAGQSAFIDKLKMKLAVFGALSVPSEVYVEIWRFTDEKLVPPIQTSTTHNILPTTDYTKADQERLDGFWTYMMSKQVGTINTDAVDSSSGDGVQIRRLWSFKFGPQDTSNPDPTSSLRCLTLDHNMNRYCKFDWNTGEGTSDIPPAAQIGNQDYYETYNSATMCSPSPNLCSRIFLVIRGDVSQLHLNTITNPQIADLYPSFDITLRRFRSMVHT